MATEACVTKQPKGLSVFEKYLTVWVILCIVVGIVMGKVAPGAATFLDGLAIYIDEAPVVSIPIAVCLFFMMYPIMVKIDFAEVLKAGKSPGPVLLTLVVNWGIKPFTMLAIAWFFLGYVFRDLMTGMDTLKDGTHVELWRSYISGAILLGIAPCTAMVL
ncbi:MAG: arsenical-resistance protein, partial [Planctomycetota bacterium]|nr:arsenical-resistance protein [Planctomycetota bacterium]